jgi:hypothetical protein
MSRFFTTSSIPSIQKDVQYKFSRRSYKIIRKLGSGQIEPEYELTLYIHPDMH